MSRGSIAFDRVASCYDATRGFPPGVEQQVAEAIARAGSLTRSSRVLEIGIGTGRIARPLARHVGAIHGIDVSRPMLDRLRDQLGDGCVHLVRGDATSLPFADRSFDAAVAVHVFHLIPGWRVVLAELRRVLRPGAPLLSAGESANPVWDVWHELADSSLAAPLRDTGVPRERILSFPQGEGWLPAAAELRLAYSQTVVPAELLRQLESRSWSATWRLGDEQLAELVQTVRRLALERVGNLEEPIDVEREFAVRAYLPPG